ncbi:MAG: antitoxin VapB family protein [Nanoarchaeota archaeon]
MSQIISVSDDVYVSLKKLKGKESYSVVIRGLLATKSNKEKILQLFGRGGVDGTKLKDLNPLWKKWSDEYA